MAAFIAGRDTGHWLDDEPAKRIAAQSRVLTHWTRREVPTRWLREVSGT